jgi:hypothetical protein
MCKKVPIWTLNLFGILKINTGPSVKALESKKHKKILHMFYSLGMQVNPFPPIAGKYPGHDVSN